MSTVKLLEQLSWQSNRLLTDRSQVRVLLQAPCGSLEKRLTHMPFTHAFTGSNPVRVTIFGGLAQLGEHLPYKQRVSGSSPLTSTIFLNAGLAQLVEQLTCNQQVEGSSPLAGTIFDPLAQLVEHLTFNQRVRRSSRLRVTISMRAWRNWQTHQTQDLAPSACRFDSCRPHQL